MDKKFIVEKITVGSTFTNCYLFACKKTGLCAVIDPGANAGLIKEHIDKLNLKPKCIIITHAHIDHIAGIPEFNLPVYAGSGDAEHFTNPIKSLSLFLGNGQIFKKPSKLLKDGEVIDIDGCILEVVEVPGHTPGSICLITDEILFSGDTLFAGGIGRTDFPDADHRLLVKMIKEKLLTLKETTKVYPGHGEVTTIGIEKRNNPYLKKL
jgi:glyoxylase-like metal-dependent hydrolase (beta-lactamase superfamily II)